MHVPHSVFMAETTGYGAIDAWLAERPGRTVERGRGTLARRDVSFVEDGKPKYGFQGDSDAEILEALDYRMRRRMISDVATAPGGSA